MKRLIVVILVALFAGCMSEPPAEAVQMGPMRLTSPAFQDGGMIPSKHTCDGKDVNPALKLTDVPSNAQSIALLVDDPDAPAGDWVHWVVWDISPAAEMAEGRPPGTEGTTSFSRTGWGGPCPPTGTHRYYFKAYALDRKLNLPTTAGKGELLKAMEGRILAQTQLMGRYKRV